MGRIAFALALPLWLAASGQAAYAFIDPPVLVPPNPVVGQSVSISVTAGDCDILEAYPYPTISQSGNAIDMVIQSSHSPDPEFCINPTITGTFAIGTFGEGNYSLQINVEYPGPNGLIIQPIGTLPFIVSAIASTPALAANAQALLILALLVAATCMLRGTHKGREKF